MSDWTFKDLEEWDERVIELGKSYGLDWFPIEYETVDYHEMISTMAYHGMPVHFHHWSHGKSFEKTHQMYNAGLEGLPYECIINSSPSIAYLLRENPLYLQILIMCHCVGHSDFFKNNVTFNGTHPDLVMGRFKRARDRVQSYIEDPSIGINDVERVIDAARAVQMQTDWYGTRRTNSENYDKIVRQLNSDNPPKKKLDLNKIPLEPDYDILAFIMEHGTHLTDWERDLISIVHDEMLYFAPQMRTKMLNEGFASHIHFKMINDLNLPSRFHLPSIKSHNQVVCAHQSRLNPYHLGFNLFKRIERDFGFEQCLIVRESMNDVSAIRTYLDEEMCQELNLFSYSDRKGDLIVDDVSDDEGWESVKDAILMNSGISSVPRIYVDDMTKSGTLVLRHEHDGRDLEISYADEVVKKISILWEDVVKLYTVIEQEPFEFPQ